MGREGKGKDHHVAAYTTRSLITVAKHGFLLGRRLDRDR